MAEIDVSGELPDLDAMAAASRERAKQVYGFKFLGQVWHARAAVPFGVIAKSVTEDMTLESALGTLTNYVVEEEREAFTAAVLDSEDVYTSDLKMLGDFFNKKSEEVVGNADT